MEKKPLSRIQEHPVQWTQDRIDWYGFSLFLGLLAFTFAMGFIAGRM